jgi:hypothetical protein
MSYPLYSSDLTKSSPAKKVGTILAVVLGSLVLGVLIVALFTWPAMLMFGVVHSYWAWLPAFGFWQTLGILVLVRLVFPTASVNQNS